MKATIATFIDELKRAVDQDRRSATLLTHERFRGLPMDTVQALTQLTVPYQALTPNENGEFLLAA